MTCRYHPGGVVEIMRGAGKDCTDAFDEIHKWVDVAAMLRNCAIGKLAPSRSVTGRRAASVVKFRASVKLGCACFCTLGCQTHRPH